MKYLVTLRYEVEVPEGATMQFEEEGEVVTNPKEIAINYVIDYIGSGNTYMYVREVDQNVTPSS